MNTHETDGRGCGQGGVGGKGRVEDGEGGRGEVVVLAWLPIVDIVPHPTLTVVTIISSSLLPSPTPLPFLSSLLDLSLS